MYKKIKNIIPIIYYKMFKTIVKNIFTSYTQGFKFYIVGAGIGSLIYKDKSIKDSNKNNTPIIQNIISLIYVSIFWPITVPVYCLLSGGPKSRKEEIIIYGLLGSWIVFFNNLFIGPMDFNFILTKCISILKKN